MNQIFERSGAGMRLASLLTVTLAAGACEFPLAPKDYRVEPRAESEDALPPSVALLRAFAGDDQDCAEAVESTCSATLARCEAEAGCVDYSACVRDISDPLATTKCQDQLGTSLAAQWAYEDLVRCWYMLDAKCSVGRDFRCAGNYDLPHSERTEFTLSERISYLFGEGLVPDFSMAACRLGTDCAEPLAVAALDSAGRHTVTVPWGEGLGGPGSAWTGYRLVTGPNIYPSRFESNLPVWGTRITVTRVLTKDFLDLLAMSYDAQQEAIFAQVVDCQSSPAPGIELSLTDPSHGIVVHEGDGPVTVNEGAVVIRDAKLGVVLELVARRGQGGDVVARHRITLPEGHLAYVRIYPEP
jgi:hypothetical protein